MVSSMFSTHSTAQHSTAQHSSVQHSTAYSLINLLNLLTHLFDEFPSRRVVRMSTEGDVPEIIRNGFINRFIIPEKQDGQVSAVFEVERACVYNPHKIA